MKKVISACVDQILEFDSEHEIDKLLEDLKFKKQRFSVLWKNTLNNGKVQIRIRKSYNNHFMEEGEESNAEK